MRSEPSIEYLRQCLECNFETGELTWRKRPLEHFKDKKSADSWNTKFPGRSAGNKMRIGYLRLSITIDGTRLHILSHRIIWALKFGAWPTFEIDHINTIRSDNSTENLREATHAENMRNRRPRAKSKTGFKGINANRNKFEARIMLAGKHVHLGTYDTAEAAHTAYHNASAKLHGVFARSSF